jgi:perosamine synthetase
MNIQKKFIPLSRPELNGKEEAYAVDAIRSSWISSTGKYVTLFEANFAKLCQTDDAISAVNGTAALHLTMAGLGVTSGDEVILPSLTYIATANAVRYLGGRPVFADVDPATWCLDPTKIEDNITPRTKGIVVVHLYGHPADMDAINRIAARHGLWVIEDAAQAHCARYKGKPVGGLATAAAFSFYGNKVFTSGEGGAVTLNNAELASRLRLLRGQGMDPQRRYYFPTVGYNFRLTNVACAMLCAQLERADVMLKRRRHIFDGYRRRLAGIGGIGFQPAAEWAEPTPWLFCITVDEEEFGRSRDELMEYLGGEQIDTRPFFLPVHTLPSHCAASDAPHRMLPVTERLSARGMNLPTYPDLSDQDLDRICAAIRSASR